MNYIVFGIQFQQAMKEAELINDPEDRAAREKLLIPRTIWTIN